MLAYSQGRQSDCHVAYVNGLRKVWQTVAKTFSLACSGSVSLLGYRVNSNVPMAAVPSALASDTATDRSERLPCFVSAGA